MNQLQAKLREAFDNLSSREQRLVLLMGAILGVLVTFVPLFLMWTANSDLEAENDELRALISRIELQRVKLRQAAQEHDAAMARYDSPTPPLGSYIESLAKAQEISIQEVTEEPPKVLGSYQRRHVKVTLPKVGLSAVIHLLDSIARSRHPVAVAELSIDHSKPGDEYDVKVGLVAYDRKRKAPGSGKDRGKAGDEG